MQVFQSFKQFSGGLTQAVIVALPRCECAAFVVPNLDVIEAGIVVAAAKIKLDKIVFEEWRASSRACSGVSDSKERTA
jgi:hypothetical protein